MSSRRHSADRMHLIGKDPMVPMRSAITELREQGFDALADELTVLREQWAKTVARHVTALSVARASAREQRRADVIPLRQAIQDHHSRARAGVEIQRGKP